MRGDGWPDRAAADPRSSRGSPQPGDVGGLRTVQAVGEDPADLAQLRRLLGGEPVEYRGPDGVT